MTQIHHSACLWLTVPYLAGNVSEHVSNIILCCYIRPVPSSYLKPTSLFCTQSLFFFKHWWISNPRQLLKEVVPIQQLTRHATQIAIIDITHLKDGAFRFVHTNHLKNTPRYNRPTDYNPSSMSDTIIWIRNVLQIEFALIQLIAQPSLCISARNTLLLRAMVVALTWLQTIIAMASSIGSTACALWNEWSFRSNRIDTAINHVHHGKRLDRSAGCVSVPIRDGWGGMWRLSMVFGWSRLMRFGGGGVGSGEAVDFGLHGGWDAYWLDEVFDCIDYWREWRGWWSVFLMGDGELRALESCWRDGYL